MLCPRCRVSVHFEFDQRNIVWNGNLTKIVYRSAYCPACLEFIVWIKRDEEPLFRLIVPDESSRNSVPSEVPGNIADDYREAALVLTKSPKASAALSRRCLQAVLRGNGYTGRDLNAEIDTLLNETDARKAIPQTLRTTVDGIRHFGNFSAHPITDVTTLQIIDVEAHEAEWCLDMLDEMFEHFYVNPARAAAKKAALDAKLAAAGKPPSKG